MNSIQNNIKSLLLFLTAFVGLTPFLMAQENVNTSGSNASGSGGSVSYSIGQVFYQIHSGSNGSVVEGVQQPYEISVITGIKEVNGINLSVIAYPNPTTDYLQLKVDASTMLSIQSLSYQLYDMIGKLLLSGKIINTKTEIDMNNLVPATYFLKVSADNTLFKSFKIVKH